MAVKNVWLKIDVEQGKMCYLTCFKPDIKNATAFHIYYRL